MDSLVVDGGFADPVMQSQQGFRALMDALSNPGTLQPLDLALTPPAPLTPELAAVALTMCDHDSPLWLAPELATDAVISWLRFHTGAPIVAEPNDAQFAFVADAASMPALESFALGTDEYPDRSTTLALALSGFNGGAPLRLKGPGIKTDAIVNPVGLPGDFIVQWAANRELFPRGIDLLLVADGQVLGLPRTTRISEGTV